MVRNAKSRRIYEDLGCYVRSTRCGRNQPHPAKHLRRLRLKPVYFFLPQHCGRGCVCSTNRPRVAYGRMRKSCAVEHRAARTTLTISPVSAWVWPGDHSRPPPPAGEPVDFDAERAKGPSVALCSTSRRLRRRFLLPRRPNPSGLMREYKKKIPDLSPICPAFVAHLLN